MGPRLATSHVPPGAAAALLVALSALALLAACGPASAADPVPPEVTIRFPLNGTAFNTSAGAPHAGQVSVEASAYVNDSDTPPENVTVSVALTPDFSTVAPGENLTLDTAVLGLHEKRVWTTMWLPEGAYTITFNASDASGPPVLSSAAFFVDFTAPTISVDAPGASSVDTVWVTVDITDATSGVDPDDVEVYYRSDCSSSWLRMTPSLVVLGGHVVGEVELTLCEGADNLVQVVANDRAGHGNSTGAVAITYDAKPPTFDRFSPASFATTDGPNVTVSAAVSDTGSGVNRSTVEVQASADGGVTWGPWTRAALATEGSRLVASFDLQLDPGAHAAIRWRAYDALGNGPGEMVVVHFTVNGPPFLISVEPEEGGQALEGQELTFSARFADPDADVVSTTFYSDIDGTLGTLSGRHEVDPSGDSFRATLSVGVHNLTVVGSDGHGNRVAYTYTFTVSQRPPPDMRPFAAIGLLGVAMAAATWYAWRRAEELDEESDREGGAGDDA